MALIDDLKVRFPDLCPETIDKYYPALALNNPEFWMCYYCAEYVPGNCDAEIILNLVAHLIVIESTAGSDSIKDVQSQSVGSVSETFVTTQGGFDGDFKEFFGSTKYGQKYLMLLSNVGGACFV